jgi:molecular chaperone GrpE
MRAESQRGWQSVTESDERDTRGSAQADGSADAPPGAPDGGASVEGPETGTVDGAELSVRGDWQRAVEEQRDKYLRLAAEYENFRKRAVRERQDAGRHAQSDLVQGLIEALDDLARFAHVDPSTVDSSKVVEGAAMVERKLLKSLAGHGLEVVNPIDHPFNPEIHEAVATEAALSPEDDHLVARVYQPGYVFNGRLLRPARVVVKQWRG